MADSAKGKIKKKEKKTSTAGSKKLAAADGDSKPAVTEGKTEVTPPTDKRPSSKSRPTSRRSRKKRGRNGASFASVSNSLSQFPRHQ